MIYGEFMYINSGPTLMLTNNRHRDVVVYSEDAEKTEFDRWGIRHKEYMYVNNGIRLTVLYDRFFESKSVLEYRMMTDGEIEYIKQKIEEHEQRFGRRIGNDDIQTKYYLNENGTDLIIEKPSR